MDPQTKTAVIYPLVGKTVRQYHVDRVLGQGGMGVVYCAHDTKLQRPVALKLLPHDVTADEDRRRRFLREARAAARVIHPAIAQVYDVDEHEGSAFIAMEWVEGKTVRDLIRSGELDLMGAIDVALQVAEGLAKAHEMGIIHRDIKPANVMMTPEGHAKVLDFGLAKLMAPGETTAGGATLPDLTLVSQTHIGQVMGTAGYMSPEQVKGQAIDGRSDIFSLAIMLFEMATGELPFQRATLMETMQAVAFDDTPSIHRFRQDLPVELQRILARCLQKKPEDRYPDARALARDLRALRRDTESGLLRAPWWQERLTETWDRIGQLNRGQWTWIGGGFLAAAVVLYLLYSDVGLGGLVFFSMVALVFYRHIRNRPQRMRELFVRRVAKIPEVRLIAAQENRLMVVVDRAPGQLYSRVNQQLNHCNRKLYFGLPLTASIRHDLAPEEERQLLTSSGVQYVRPDAALPSVGQLEAH